LERTIRQFKNAVQTHSVPAYIWGQQDISGAVLNRSILVESDRLQGAI
jgi:hypothetical protein